jgi:glutaredoxin
MITIYSKNNCPHCTNAKQYLERKNISYREINIESDLEAREFVLGHGHRTMPQIYMDGKIFVEGGWAGLSKMSAEDIISEIDLRNSLADQSL